MTSFLTTKLRDVHYNPCFEERAGHVFISPTGLRYFISYRLKITNKIRFVEMGKKMRKTLSGVQEIDISAAT